jgi:hypothetical protein
MSIMISRGSTNLAFPYICAMAVAAQGNVSVEVLLPKGRRHLELCGSCWSAVLGVDADGGAPDGDFPKEGSSRVAARRCPYRLFAVLAGAVSNLICEAENELRPLRQILAPNVMIMKRLRNTGKPRERSRVGGCGFWEAPVQHGGYVFRGVEFSSGGGCVQVDEGVFTGLGRQSDQVCP